MLPWIGLAGRKINATVKSSKREREGKAEKRDRRGKRQPVRIAFYPAVRNEAVGGGKNCEERRVKGNEKTVGLWGRHRTIIPSSRFFFDSLSLSSQVRGFIQQLGRTWPRIIDIACNVTFQSSNDVGMLQKGWARRRREPREIFWTQGWLRLWEWLVLFDLGYPRFNFLGWILFSCYFEFWISRLIIHWSINSPSYSFTAGKGIT